MLKMAFWGLVIVAVAGILAAAILFVARAIAALLGIAILAGAVFLVLKLALRAFRTKKA